MLLPIDQIPHIGDGKEMCRRIDGTFEQAIVPCFVRSGDEENKIYPMYHVNAVIHIL